MNADNVLEQNEQFRIAFYLSVADPGFVSFLISANFTIIDDDQVLPPPVTNPVSNTGNLEGARTEMGDFDGDGHSDILWRGKGDEVAVWQMNGSQVVSGGLAPNLGSYWSIAGTDDFDSDDRTDILWRGKGDEVAVWQMNGSQVITSSLAPNSGGYWQVIA